MTFNEAKQIFHNRGFVEVEGGTIFDPDKWREACGVISKWLDQEPRKGHWLSQREYCEMNNLIPSGLGSYFWCSECNHAVDVKEWNKNHYNYCPNCGADMKEVENDTD